jgi:signal peptidase I
MVKLLKELVPYIIVILAVILIRLFIATPVRVTGPSMLPTLNNKEVMIMVKVTKYFASYKRFQIVVIKYGDTYLIKRIIGLPGEKIKCEDGNIHINGEAIEDDYGSGYTLDFKEVTLGDDEYFVMGDNREVSQDSRVIGPIKETNIKGYTNLVIYPLNKIRKTK